MRMKRVSAVVVVPLLMLGMASAHVSFIDAKPLVEGKAFKATFAVPHGCDGTATTNVTVQIPEGVIGVKPMPKVDWNIDAETVQYTKSYQQYGKEVTEGIHSLTWKGSLPDQYYDEFTFTGFFAENADDVDQLYFPVTQECEVGQYLWTDTSGEHHHGHDAEELGAPFLDILKAK